MHCIVCYRDAFRSFRFCPHCGAALHHPERRRPASAPQESPVTHELPRHDGSELKHCTVLFADIVSSTEEIAGLDAEQAMRRLQPALTTMCAVIEKFAGTVVRTLGDGVMAVFGAPRMLKDDARLACEAALCMQSLFRSGASRLDIRIGLHSGVIAVEPWAHDAGRGGGVHGLTVHIASRVMALSPPTGVMLSAATAALVRKRMSVRMAGRFPAKGIVDPIEAFELTGARSTPSESRETLLSAEWRAELASLHRTRRAGARIDALDPPVKSLLQACAVLGPHITIAALSRLMGASPDVIHRQMASLCHSGLLARASSAPAQAYAFRSPLLQETACRMQMQARRIQMMARITAVADPLREPAFTSRAPANARELRPSSSLAAV